MARHIYARDHPIEGEVWLPTPCGLAFVSDHGRLKNIAGELMKAFKPHADEIPKWHVRHAGREIQYIPASLVAQVFLRGSGGRGGLPDFKNGDPTDWRASNLIVPWTPEQDAVIVESVSCRAAANALGLGRYAVRTRARALGKTWPRTTRPVRPLSERLDAVQEAIPILQAVGVSEGRINLALSVDGRKKFAYGRAIDPEAKNVCLKALFEHGMPLARIGEAFGFVNGVHTARGKLRALGLIKPTGWVGATPQGLPEEVAGEEWREHPWGYWISSLGRVAGKKGLLKVGFPNSTSRTPSVYLQGPDGHKTTTAVARLVLAAFRPDLPYSHKIFLNGDHTDVRLANIRSTSVDAATVAQIRKRLPGYLQAADRDEAQQAAVLALMEGRATTVAEAVTIGVREKSEIAGTNKNVSLDSEIGDGATRMDYLTSEGTFTTRDRQSAKRSRGT